MRSLRLPFFFLLISLNANAQWTRTAGPVGGKSNEILTIGDYLFVNGFDGGIYRSTNKGLTWESVSNGLPVDLRCFAMDAEDEKLFITTHNGTYVSSDLGESWNMLADHSVSGFAIEVSGNEIFVGSSNGAILYSPDSGGTWQLKVSSVGGEGVRHLLKWNGTLWLGTGSNAYYSSDNGSSWTHSPLDLIISSIDTAGDALFISGNDEYGFFGVYRSEDDGVSWTKILSTPETNVPSSGFLKINNSMYATGFRSLYYSDDDGQTWNTQPLPESFNFFQETFIAQVEGDLFISYGDGMLFTADRGLTWERRNIGYKNHTIVQLAKTNQSIISYSEINGISISKDNGGSWKWIPDQDDYRPRQIYAHNNTIIASYLLGIYKSEDEGETWQKTFTLTDDIPGPHAIPDVHLAGWEKSLIYCTYKGVYFSSDMGASWKLRPASSFDTNANILKGFIKQDSVVLLTKDEFFFSADFGDTWQKRAIPEGLFVSYYSVTDMLFESTLTMSTLFGLYKSSDFGVSWKKMECVPDRTIFEMERIGETLIIGTLSGAYGSQNGINWYSAQDGLESARTLAMTIKDAYAFVGTWGKSVWKRPLAELLKPGEILENGEEVPKPVVTNTCSTITVANAKQSFQIKWYRDGSLLANENGTTLHLTSKGIYQVSFENNCDLKMSDPIVLDNAQTTTPKIYNVVTVNGDHKNDYYFMDASLVGSRLNIYNRWGQIVYSSESYKNDWSPEIPGGQYYYMIENECVGKFNGVLTILKP